MSATEHVALAVLTESVSHIKEFVTRIDTNVSEIRKEAVSRSMWEQRNEYVDQKLAGQEKEMHAIETQVHKSIADIWTELRSRKAPWTAIGALAVAGLLGLLELIERLGN